jgi:hypothetical protein
MFTGLEGDHYKKVVCIHSADIAPPDPLKHLQAVPAKEEKLVQFLHELFCECTLTQLEEPLNKNICEQQDEIRRAAKELALALGRKALRTVSFGDRLTLRIENPKIMAEDKIPSDAVVECSEQLLWLFNKIHGTWKWQDLEDEARENIDQRWLRELAKAMYLASRGQAFDPVQATFAARRGAKVYRPILHQAAWLADGSLEFHILFEEDVSWNLKDIPPSVAVVLTSQVMAIRFRYEVLKKYDSILDSVDVDETHENIFTEIRDAIEKIEEEARSRGILKKDLLASMFNGNQERVSEMFEDWYAVKAKLFKACDSKDADETRRLIQKLLDYNTEFIPMAANYYYKLVDEALDREKFAVPIM